MQTVVAQDIEKSSNPTAKESPGKEESTEVIATKTKLPSADQLIDSHINALGGYEVLESIENSRYQATAKGNGQVYDYECFQANGKFKSIHDYETGQKLIRGSANNMSWQYFEGATPMAITGQQLHEYTRDRQFLMPATKWLETHKEIEVLGIEPINQRETYKVHFVRKDGTKVTKYFDVETYLLIRKETDEQYQTGNRHVVRDYFDYRRVGETVFPHRLDISFGGQKFVYEVTNVEFDAELPDEAFAVPKNLMPEHEAEWLKDLFPPIEKTMTRETVIRLIEEMKKKRER